MWSMPSSTNRNLHSFSLAGWTLYNSGATEVLKTSTKTALLCLLARYSNFACTLLQFCLHVAPILLALKSDWRFVEH